MSADVPRRLPPTQGERVRNIDRGHASLSARGRTASARPVPQQPPAATIYQPPTTSVGAAADRLVVTKDVTLTGNPTDVTSWQAVHEAVGASVGVASPDDGGIYIHTAGVYALTIQLVQAFMHSATVDCSVGAFIYDNTDNLWILPTAQLRGGDGQIAVSSSIQYCPAGTVARAQVFYDHVDPALITGATVWVIAQRIS